MVGDGDAMGVSAQVLQHILGTTEGWFRVDHPVLTEQGPQPGCKGPRLSKQDEVAVELECAFAECGPKSGDELAAKDTTEYLDGEKEARAGSDPAGVIEREPTGGDDTVDVGMEPELLVPGMEHTEEADLGAEMSGIAGDFEKSFCTGTEQQIVDDLFIL